MHILKINDIDEDRIKKIFATADLAKKYNGCNYHPIRKWAVSKVLANLFFEPSTRTRLSFDVAMQQIGGKVITVANGSSSSAMKGESLGDTLRTVSQYADVIVTRTREKHNDFRIKDIHVPIINAGDGDGEHPTQALLDLYTIRKYFKDEFSILFLGDMKYGRTVHSLMQLLSRYNCKIYHGCPDSRDLPIHLRELSERKLKWKKVLPDVDVVYCTREQKERTKEWIPYYVGDYGFHTQEIDVLKEGAILMHPFPRGGEMPVRFDKDPRAKYFEQAKNSVYVRMGILMEILGL